MLEDLLPHRERQEISVWLLGLHKGRIQVFGEVARYDDVAVEGDHDVRVWMLRRLEHPQLVGESQALVVRLADADLDVQLFERMPYLGRHAVDEVGAAAR